MIRTFSRRAALLGPVLMALALAAQPAAAETPISDSGNQGPYQINDSPGTRGANCLYEGNKTNNKYLLDKISIRPPVVHSYDTGSGNQNQWVGWRYIIQRDTNFDGMYGDLYKSGWVKDKADEAIPADFVRRTWTSSEDPQGNYRVWIVIKWYEYGSSTVTDGKVVEELDYYRTIRGNGVEQGQRMNSCYKAFN